MATLGWLKGLGNLEAARFVRLNRDLKRACEAEIDVRLPKEPTVKVNGSGYAFALVTLNSGADTLLVHPALLASKPPQFVARYVLHRGFLARAKQLGLISEDDFDLRDQQYPRRNDAVKWLESRLEQPISG